VSSAASIGFLAAVNFFTSPQFPWFIFPAFAIGSGVLRQWSSLWSEGVTLKQIFGGGAVKPAAPGAAQLAPPAAPAPDPAALAAALAPADVVAGPLGEPVKRAAVDRAAVLGIVESLGKSDRDLIPDVVPTVNALAERVGAVAQLLHHLDRDMKPGQLAELDARIAAVKTEPSENAEHERRLSLLERQRASLAELATRRERLEGQLESAQIALQNLKYDLLKLRSSGVQSAIGEVNSATVEARALSKEIGHVLDAADEIRKI